MSNVKTCTKCGESKALVHGRQCQSCRTAAQRARRQSKAALRPKPKCKICGCEFTKSGNYQIFCGSEDCESKAKAEYQREFRRTDKYNAWYADYHGTDAAPGERKAEISAIAAARTPEDLREREQAYQRKWIEKNRGKFNAKAARRRAALYDATPEWAEHDEIEVIYENCPEGYEVDHVIPLQGENTCRAIQSMLHAPWNLRVVPMSENRSKGNKYEGV
ncbi:hypothetical protein [Ruegeria sp. HKCCD7221]|uniref:hypothetical protein n=1 Tax=Ruegeria sp. HKCCD7221 TaxID=2683009 RepID=UPI00148896BA|nr:hypothetical protein [Ruegeria sp. HKCCD7221]